MKGSKKQRRKGKITNLNAEFQRIARRDKKAFLSDQDREIEKDNGTPLQYSCLENPVDGGAW